MKSVYIHFENRPELSALTKFFANFPNYRRVFATSYSFDVPHEVTAGTVADYARVCFPYGGYVICYGGKFYARMEESLFLTEPDSIK